MVVDWWMLRVGTPLCVGLDLAHTGFRSMTEDETIRCTVGLVTKVVGAWVL